MYLELYYLFRWDQTRIVLVLAAMVVLVGVVHGKSDNSQYYNGVVAASEILNSINKSEPVEYDHVIVKGDLDLVKVSLPKETCDRTDYRNI
jgi:hypothetical protein